LQEYILSIIYGYLLLAQLLDCKSRRTGARIDSTISNTRITREALDKSTNLPSPATAYYDVVDGSYVVRNDNSKVVIAISNKNDPNWKPDPTIINPYIIKK
jgi:hypothetical protein